MVHWLRFSAPGAGGPRFDPGWGTRSHKPQLRVCMPPLKIPHAKTKTWYSQISKYIFKKKRNKNKKERKKQNIAVANNLPLV